MQYCDLFTKMLQGDLFALDLPWCWCVWNSYKVLITRARNASFHQYRWPPVLTVSVDHLLFLLQVSNRRRASHDLTCSSSISWNSRIIKTPVINHMTFALVSDLSPSSKILYWKSCAGTESWRRVLFNSSLRQVWYITFDWHSTMYLATRCMYVTHWCGQTF